VLEGRFVALVHPAVMGALFLYTGYAGWLGWQWRRTRTIGDDIKAAKAAAPKPAAAAAVAEGAAAAPPAPVDPQVAALEAVSFLFFFDSVCTYVCARNDIVARRDRRRRRD
jgi:hypothetical protein